MNYKFIVIEMRIHEQSVTPTRFHAKVTNLIQTSSCFHFSQNHKASTTATKLIDMEKKSGSAPVEIANLESPAPNFNSTPSDDSKLQYTGSPKKNIKWNLPAEIETIWIA